MSINLTEANSMQRGCRGPSVAVFAAFVVGVLCGAGLDRIVFSRPSPEQRTTNPLHESLIGDWIGRGTRIKFVSDGTLIGFYPKNPKLSSDIRVLRNLKETDWAVARTTASSSADSYRWVEDETIEMTFQERFLKPTKVFRAKVVIVGDELQLLGQENLPSEFVRLREFGPGYEN